MKQVEYFCNICGMKIKDDDGGVGLYFKEVIEGGERISGIVKRKLRDAEKHLCNDCLVSVKYVCEHVFV